MTTNDMRVALQRGVPAQVPIWELEFHAWDAASRRHVVLGKEFEALSATEQERALHTNAEIMLSVAVEMGWAGLTVPGGYWEEAPGKLAYYCLPEAGRYRQAEALKKLSPPDLMLVAGVGGVISANYSEEFCLLMYEDPASIDRRAENCLRGSLEVMRRFRDLGVEAVFTASDIADNSGPFFNPAQMERWVYPYLRRWAEAVRGFGLFSILHTDGNITPYLDRLAETGVEALQAIDPVAGMDLVATKRQIGGRLCLCGNIDCGLLLTSTPERVFAATRQLLTTCKTGGGWVLGASNAVQPQVPVANYRAMIAAAREFGGAGR